ncbi:hypothetical protein HY768_11360 [candidate division TA06 bacterium]|uniref:Uncharacterized protein n=1 Tax=candidate division TA06 bacterium TaxID=2250710 RepID=A0A933IG53_UNCT6|nr:hypothetical protein [candidate division TA06 bacterium]
MEKIFMKTHNNLYANICDFENTSAGLRPGSAWQLSAGLWLENFKTQPLEPLLLQEKGTGDEFGVGVVSLLNPALIYPPKL